LKYEIIFHNFVCRSFPTPAPAPAKYAGAPAPVLRLRYSGAQLYLRDTAEGANQNAQRPFFNTETILNIYILSHTLTISVQVAVATDQTRIVLSGDAVNATS
jgi:hypothetical protein